MPNFNSIRRNELNLNSNLEDLDLMIIDIETKYENKKTSNFDDNTEKNDNNPLYLARELLNWNNSPINIKSLFLPDEEDVFFNNKDLKNKKPHKLISDEEIMKKKALPNSFRRKLKKNLKNSAI